MLKGQIIDIENCPIIVLYIKIKAFLMVVVFETLAIIMSMVARLVQSGHATRGPGSLRESSGVYRVLTF